MGREVGSEEEASELVLEGKQRGGEWWELVRQEVKCLVPSLLGVTRVGPALILRLALTLTSCCVNQTVSTHW